MYVVTSMLGLASMLEVLPLTRRVSRSRLLKGGATVNTTLCRTHELKSGDRRRPETERQGLAPRPSHDSRVASREFVTHRVRYTGTARPNPIIGTPGVVTCASSLRCELHWRLQSPQVTTEDCPKTLLRDTGPTAQETQSTRGKNQSRPSRNGMTRPRTPHPYTAAAYSRRSGAKQTIKNPQS